MHITKQPLRPGILIETGILTLDLALEGGFGHEMIELYGGQSSGKTTLAYNCLAAAQQQGFDVLLVPKQRLDTKLAETAGLYLPEVALLSGRPDHVLPLMLDFIRKPQRCCFIDDADAQDWRYEHLTALRNNLDTAAFIMLASQVRAQYRNGKPIHKTNSSLWRFKDRIDCSIECEVAKKEGTLQDLHLSIESPWRQNSNVSLPFRHLHGVDAARDLVRLAIDHVVLIRKGAAGYRYGDRQLGTSIDDVVDELSGQSGTLYKIRQEVLAKMGH